jgi:hypothetical protein
MERARTSSMVVVSLASLLIGGGAGFALGYLISPEERGSGNRRVTVPPPAEHVEVPDVIGREPGQATHVLATAGLIPVVRIQGDNGGIVASQRPEPATDVLKGAVVTLLVR